MIDWALVIIGLVLLLTGGDALVRGAVALSARLGIPTLIVSLTVVAFGTSAPELLIAVQSALDGVSELALGNVVGSNTANVLLVLGVPAIISGLRSEDPDSRINYYYMMGATVFFIGLAYTHPLMKWQGILLLLGLALMLYLSYRSAMASRSKLKALEAEVEQAHIPTWQMVTFLGVGLVFLPLGAKFLVDGSVNISRSFGVPEEVIGLTLIALGTSLPELATTVVACMKKQGDVAIGNVLGSNMFNILGIVGVASLMGPLEIPQEFFALDFWIMLAASLLLAPFVVGKRKLSRSWGIFFVMCYIVYVVYLFWHL